VSNIVNVYRRDAKDAKRKEVFLSADPGGIGSAFHRAEEGRKGKSDVIVNEPED
jgi:hypothetical protein